jgi:peptidoglycan/xylan/chitin deacetylase (PgdA/CDA1 family)
MVLVLGGAIVVVVGLVVFWIEPLGAVGVLERLTPIMVYRVRTKLPLVALSFDDGPHPEFTPQVLEILKRHDAKATFFLIGERALRYPEVVARIRAEGHEIGNHYFKNGTTLGHSDEEFLGNLEKTERAIAAEVKLAVGSETGPIGRSAFPEKEGLKSSQQEEKSTARNGCATKAWEQECCGEEKRTQPGMAVLRDC